MDHIQNSYNLVFLVVLSNWKEKYTKLRPQKLTCSHFKLKSMVQTSLSYLFSLKKINKDGLK
jgi:hypothetical protein